MAERYDPIAILARHDGGDLADQMREMMQRVVRDVVRYGGVGEMTVKIRVKPTGEKGVALLPEVSSKAPKRAAGQAFYYPDEDGDLFRQAPESEADMLLRSVPSGLAKA
jgi:hypothetical protein